MNNIYTNDDNNIFPKGYPKRIFYKHTVPQRIYILSIKKESFDSIIGVHPPRIEYWKIVLSPLEESKLLNKKKVLEPILSEPIVSKPILTRSKSSYCF
jgi:hypothetical protein